MAVTNASGVSLSLNDRMIAALLSLFIGAFLVFGAGLAHSSALHDTAHDVRHSFGFPCH
ncbi:cobalt transporter [Rhizobium sp. Leaf384]|uniref:CbtB domain-containing protein n=1 Tax=unclassified Rhizobium TaxID=2613769 RepID=UPI0007136517|nr:MULTISPECIES: CbtB-domain containing protein [unclassified Rhizobium]KQR69478.1 cobalt transporter [Rhizobium sp. Leaf341]KQS79627.1 cobalt transporter [Rhizobium sp. Leaf384]KQS85133.1 cobalt transporter [Rhizobium sp. Leaf383]